MPSDEEPLPLTRSIHDRIAPESEASRWVRSQRDYMACHPAWRSVPGGRALHAFMDGDTKALCGVEAPVWRDHSRGWGAIRRPEHRRCGELARRETGRRISELFERQRREYVEEVDHGRVG